MKKLLQNKALMAAAAVTTLASSACAQEAESTIEQVGAQFQSLITDAIPVIIGLVTAAVGIFGIFAGIRWLKRALKSGS